MTQDLLRLQELVEDIMPNGGKFLSHIENTEGVHTPMFASMLLDLLELEQSTGGDDMAIYTAIRDIVRSDMMECEIADQIKDKVANIAINKAKRSVLARVLRKQAQTRQQLLAAGKAVEFPELSSREIDEDDQYVFGSLDNLFGLVGEQEQEPIDRTVADGTLSSLYQAVMDTEAYGKNNEVSAGQKADPVQSIGPGLSKEPIPFQGNEDALRQALNNIFESIGQLEGAPVDALYISDRLDTAIQRCLQFAYEFTGNSRSKMSDYVRVLDEFSESDNKLKNDLYNQVDRVCDYVDQYDHSTHGLNPSYDTLRLSQVIPNYFLKTKGYVLDASACSSGKTGTILLAPVVTNSKVSVVLVENNTYETILEEFKTWYSTRDDYTIVTKDEFWPTSTFDWTSVDENVIIILDKAFVSRIDDSQREQIGAETFTSIVKRSGIELLVSDEVHNYKGRDAGQGFKVVESGSDELDIAHSNCSYCNHTLAINAKYRLFSSATPLLNDLEEPARILSMLLPATYETRDKNYRHQETLRQITDNPNATEGILEKTAVLYTPLQSNTTRVPKPKVDYDVEIISNEGTQLVDGKIVPGKSNWISSWTSELQDLVTQQNNEWSEQGKSPYWSDQRQDEVHFDLYLTMMEKQIVDSLRSGKQICFYTNDSMQTHEDLKDRILKIAEDHDLNLKKNEVVIANGKTSTELRKPVAVKGFSHKRPELIKRVWTKKCKVLIANSVIEVGLDGLQGTDIIQQCGRISVVFLLANPYTDAAKYQLFSRFVRTQGADTNKLPEVKFYQPHLYWNTAPEGESENIYSRNEQTNQRIYLKKLRSDLLLDGIFPEGVNISELKREIPKMIYRQYNDGTFNTEEGREELEDKTIEILGGSGVCPTNT